MTEENKEWTYKARAENLRNSLDSAYRVLSGIRLNEDPEYRIIFEAIVSLEGILRIYEERMKAGFG